MTKSPPKGFISRYQHSGDWVSTQEFGGWGSINIQSITLSQFFYNTVLFDSLGLPGGSEVKASSCNAGDLGSIPGLGRSPGEGNGNPLQYSCWRIPWTEEPGGLQSTGSQRVGHY